MVTSQYYSEVKDLDAEKIIPQFKITGITHSLSNQIYKIFNPQAGKIEGADQTVDQVILSINAGNMVTKILPSDGENDAIQESQEIILKEGRKKLSEIVGTELTGQEKFSEITIRVINEKIKNLFSKNLVSDSFPLLPLILSLIIFIAVAPLGSFLVPIWNFLIKIIFNILLKFKFITISKIPTEMEIIE